tara:strand:- start:647 stop:862 length:216 start_codon:yes stop_codon:yes gene_type:complete
MNESPLTLEQFNVLVALIDAGIKSTGINGITPNLPSAIQAFASLQPQQEPSAFSPPAEETGNVSAEILADE